MGREFARLSVELSNEYDLSSGLDDSSLGINSASFHGPRGSDTDISSAFSSLNSIASNNTKYTIIDIVDNGAIVESEPAPTGGAEGDLWFNETTGELYVYVDSVGWVQTNGGGGGGSGGGSGGGATVKYLLDPVAVFIGAPADDKWISYDIPANVPSDATGIIVRFEARADQGTFSVLAKTTSWNQRRVCLALADAPGNVSDGASDVNTFIIPYSSTIDVKVDHNGTGDARFYVDGYIAGGSGGSGGSSGTVSGSGQLIAYGLFSDGTATMPADQLFNASVTKYASTGTASLRSTVTVTDIGPTGKALAIAVGNTVVSPTNSLGGQSGAILTSSSKSFQIITDGSPIVTFSVISLPGD